VTLVSLQQMVLDIIYILNIRIPKIPFEPERLDSNHIRQRGPTFFPVFPLLEIEIYWERMTDSAHWKSS